jgi:hypothetical protein
VVLAEVLAQGVQALDLGLQFADAAHHRQF